MAAEISVIVPVYNTEKYVEECIESVLAQTYTDFELILIDDGSEDNSREICREMGRKDDRIRLIQMEHRGVSAARNAGMDAAVGKYLFFLDSDDMIHPQLLEALYEVQEKNQTVIASVGWYSDEDDNFQKAEHWKIKTDNMWESIYLDSENAIQYGVFRNTTITLYGIGGKMIQRKAVEFVRFDESLSHGEDTLFLYQLLFKGADASALLLNRYYYRLHKMRATRNDSLKAYQSWYKAKYYMREHEIESGRMSNVIYLEWVILSDIIEWRKMSRKKQDIDLEKAIKQWIDVEKTKDVFLELSWWNKLEVYLGIYCYPLYCFIHIVMKYISKRNSNESEMV